MKIWGLTISSLLMPYYLYASVAHLTIHNTTGEDLHINFKFPKGTVLGFGEFSADQMPNVIRSGWPNVWNRPDKNKAHIMTAKPVKPGQTTFTFSSNLLNPASASAGSVSSLPVQLLVCGMNHKGESIAFDFAIKFKKRLTSGNPTVITLGFQEFSPHYVQGVRGKLEEQNSLGRVKPVTQLIMDYLVPDTETSYATVTPGLKSFGKTDLGPAPKVHIEEKSS